MKGKKITEVQYNDMLSEHIRTSMKGQRNPYWSVRY